MRGRHISHHGYWQTAPQIYADRPKYACGHTAIGSYHQWQIGMSLSGFCRYRMGNRDLIILPGDVNVVRPHTTVNLRVCPPPSVVPDYDASLVPPDNSLDCVYAVFHPYPHWEPWLGSFDYVDGIAQIHMREPNRTTVQNALLKVVEAYQTRSDFRDDETLNALEAALIILRRCTSTQQHSSDSRVQNAIDFIHRRFSDPLNVADIAQEVGLSTNWLSSLFRTAMGVGPAQYLERVRLARAAEMLRFSPDSVRTIALNAGYQDAFYFAYRFRLQYKQSPSQYRKSGRPPSSGPS